MVACKTESETGDDRFRNPYSARSAVQNTAQIINPHRIVSSEYAYFHIESGKKVAIILEEIEGPKDENIGRLIERVPRVFPIR
ncbi:MAG: hypothetical protein HW387_156 [Parachlamydiales bacterium]|nr:hypothetical protein [Parachlamydiales bacterium]